MHAMSKTCGFMTSKTMSILSSLRLKSSLRLSTLLTDHDRMVYTCVTKLDNIVTNMHICADTSES